MIKVFTTSQQRLGERGEQIAVEYLKKNGFSILERNFATKDGEIDIIGQKDTMIYFVEVKTTSIRHDNVLYKNQYKPEYNVSREKLIRLRKCAENYIFSHNVSCETHFSAILIQIDKKYKKAHLRFMKNIIIEDPEE
ncbi:YraN family protein [Candidatus Nomurabacteria bacterium]|nr:YraN family protein [Candidatus Nomurabacteria bacterium]